MLLLAARVSEDGQVTRERLVNQKGWAKVTHVHCENRYLGTFGFLVSWDLRLK